VSAKTRYGPGSGRGSLPGERRRKMFSDTTDPEQIANYVRHLYNDRLEAAFDDPTLYLKDVLESVIQAEEMAAAVIESDHAELVRLPRELLERRARMKAAGVSGGALGLLESLQWALFPELYRPEFNDEFAVREHQARIRGEKISRGEKPWAVFPEPRPACPTCKRSLPVRKPDSGGLVPRGGGERVGVGRLLALASSMGIDP